MAHVLGITNDKSETVRPLFKNLVLRLECFYQIGAGDLDI